MEKNIFKRFLVRKELSNEDVGMTRDAVFQELQPGAGFYNRRFR